MPEQPALEKFIAFASALMAELESQAFQDERFAELSMRQMLYLNTIIRMGHPNFSELARKLGVSKPSVTAIVTTLIKKGYVKKVQDDEDRRSFHIILTAQGVQFDQLHESIHKCLADLLASRLDGEEVQQLTRLLEKVTQSNEG
jgi:DNA-binding MarR family transcriptional regulator